MAILPILLSVFMFQLQASFLIANAATPSPACLLKPDGGLCEAYMPRWYFNHATSKCTQFIYGGCGGVVPFTTLKNCQNASCKANKCFSKPQRGPCKRNDVKWYYNRQTKLCQTFLYGGCGGNVPFNSKYECRKGGCNASCTQIPDKGRCRARKIRWFFDNQSNRCRQFIWGGCGGSVPFDTLKQCTAAQCLPKRTPTPKPILPKERCLLSPNPGSCVPAQKNVIRWYWDKTTSSCKSFSYTGCLGVVPFTTKVQCIASQCDKQKCFVTKQDVLQKRGKISCRRLFRSWYYDRKNGKCQSFWYGACKNLGPFGSQQACASAKCNV